MGGKHDLSYSLTNPAAWVKPGLMAETQAHAMFRERTKGLSNARIAEILGCSPPNVSQIKAGQSLSDERRVIARDTWGIPIDAWSIPAVRSEGPPRTRRERKARRASRRGEVRA